MTCEQFVELVTAYLEGTLDASTTVRFTTHLAECDGCDVYLAQIRETVDLLSALTAESLTVPAREHMLAAFHDWQQR